MIGRQNVRMLQTLQVIGVGSVVCTVALKVSFVGVFTPNVAPQRRHVNNRGLISVIIQSLSLRRLQSPVQYSFLFST